MKYQYNIASKGIRTLLLLAFIILTQQAFAQQIHPCGTPPYHTDWFKDYMRDRDNYRSGADTVLYVPMTIHILGTDAGNNYASMMDVLDAFCGLGRDFKENGSNIAFFMEGDINYINNSDWINHPTVVVGYDMMTQNNVPNTINTYVVSNPAGNAGYNLPSAPGIAMRNSYMNLTAHTWAHEVGHNLSVQHTFLGWEGKTYNYNDTTPTTVTYDYTLFKPVLYTDTTIIDTAYVELVDRSNCLYAADGFCDTEPDYLSFGGWQCNGNGQSAIIQRDPNFMDFRSDATNIMTYSDDNCGGTFTSDQIAAMRANLLTQKASYLYSQNTTIDTITAAITPTFPLNNDEADAANAELIWNAVPNATHYVVQVGILPNYGILHAEVITTDTSVTFNDLAPNGIYYWRVRPYNSTYTCTNLSTSQSFTAKAFASSTAHFDNIQYVRLRPNILARSQNMQLTIAATSNEDARISIFATNGQIVQEMNLAILAGENNFTIPTTPFASGMYFARITTSEGIITRKFIVE